ncbi:MAG TPA: twin-arginine translocation signal domain-containing protein, partial [Geminicoccaceae bacterium]|nr:twin-arginine translocation signal domain-containing protein [Geminicoccaceae bacterium]
MSPKPSRITRRRFLAGSALAGVGLASGGPLRPFAPALAAGQVHLRLLETTDVHVHVLPYDYYRDREDHTVGLAKVATLIGRARAEA